VLGRQDEPARCRFRLFAAAVPGRMETRSGASCGLA
jgi:hypothetical protein